MRNVGFRLPESGAQAPASVVDAAAKHAECASEASPPRPAAAHLNAAATALIDREDNSPLALRQRQHQRRKEEHGEALNRFATALGERNGASMRDILTSLPFEIAMMVANRRYPAEQTARKQGGAALPDWLRPPTLPACILAADGCVDILKDLQAFVDLGACELPENLEETNFYSPMLYAAVNGHTAVLNWLACQGIALHDVEEMQLRYVNDATLQWVVSLKYFYEPIKAAMAAVREQRLEHIDLLFTKTQLSPLDAFHTDDPELPRGWLEYAKQKQAWDAAIKVISLAPPGGGGRRQPMTWTCTTGSTSRALT